uniref:Multidrug-efflux transporter n=1 Tax=Candidatus Kentrum sp. MB TaxID=2138164 RepID=A0A451B7G1_9GAMM|nr:MAG: multidrug resistance protein, MATE family [Candidatus Kentron sp. MB]VFK74216.1 MAG: multidrug resistance protein, MATE family [Candidatus Kentron sp. MB]
MPSNPTESLLPKAADIYATLGISLPLVFGYLGKITIDVTDSVMLGRLGPDALGAAGLAASAYIVFPVIGMGILFPIMVLVSQARGAGRSGITHGIVRQGLWIAGALFIPACAFLWNLEDILIRTGQDASLARMAGDYMDYRLWGMLPWFFSLVFIFALTAMGRTRAIFLVSWLEAGLNVVLNYLFIFGKFGFPAMGVAGAGLASLMVFSTGCAIFFTLFGFHRLFRRGVLRRAWRPKWPVLEQILRLGWPKSLELIINKSLFSITTLLAGWFGAGVVAAHTMAFQTSQMVFFIVSLPLSDAITTRVGIAYGRESRAGMWRIFNSGVLLLLLFILPIAIILDGFPEWIVALFLGFGTQKAQDLMPVASPLITFIALFVVVDGLRMITDRALNGLSDMKAPALIAILSHWGIGFSSGVFLGFAMDGGILGLWIGLTIGMATATIFYLARFWWLIRGKGPSADRRFF